MAAFSVPRSRPPAGPRHGRQGVDHGDRPARVFLEDANTYAQLVETMTNGDIKMNVFAPGMLGKDLKVTDIVKSGVAQVGHNWMGYDWGVDKATVIFAGMSGGLQPEELLMYLFQAGGAEMWFRVPQGSVRRRVDSVRHLSDRALPPLQQEDRDA